MDRHGEQKKPVLLSVVHLEVMSDDHHFEASIPPRGG
jgi:hypothetical protein